MGELTEMERLWREAPGHATWLALHRERGTLTHDRRVLDARWLLRVATVAGVRLPVRAELAERWGLRRPHDASDVLSRARSSGPSTTPALRLEDLRGPLRERRAALDRALRLDRRHDAWLAEQLPTSGRARRVSPEVARVDLDVMRWRERQGLTAELTLDVLARRWGWGPRADVAPLLVDHVSPQIPTYDHLEAADVR